MQHPHPEYQTEPYRHASSSSEISGSTVLNNLPTGSCGIQQPMMQVSGAKLGRRK